MTQHSPTLNTTLVTTQYKYKPEAEEGQFSFNIVLTTITILSLHQWNNKLPGGVDNTILSLHQLNNKLPGGVDDNITLCINAMGTDSRSASKRDNYNINSTPFIQRNRKSCQKEWTRRPADPQTVSTLPRLIFYPYPTTTPLINICTTSWLDPAINPIDIF